MTTDILKIFDTNFYQKVKKLLEEMLVSILKKQYELYDLPKLLGVYKATYRGRHLHYTNSSALLVNQNTKSKRQLHPSLHNEADFYIQNLQKLLTVNSRVKNFLKDLVAFNYNNEIKLPQQHIPINLQKIIYTSTISYVDGYKYKDAQLIHTLIDDLNVLLLSQGY